MSTVHARALLAIALLGSLIPVPTWAADSHHEHDDVFTAEPVSEHVWVIYGRGGNIGVIVTTDGVVIIDTSVAGITSDVVSEIRTITDQPIRYVVNTHLHADHTGGNAVLQEYADIVAHQNTFDRLREERDEDPVPPRTAGLPQITFEEELRFHVGGVEIHAMHLKRAHTDTDVAVWLPGENVMHTGDLMFNQIIPYVDKGRGAHTGQWMEFLVALYQMSDDDTHIIPGHGEVTDRQGLVRMFEYFKTVRDRVTVAIAEGASREEVMALDFSNAGFASWEGLTRIDMALSAAYTEIAGNGTTLVIVNKADDEVAFVDVSTGDVRGKAKVGPEPHEVATTVDGSVAYVTNYGSGRPAGSGSRSWLTVVDISSMGPLRDIELRDPSTGTYLGMPHGIVVDRDGSHLWVTCEGDAAVIRIALPDETIDAVYRTKESVSHMVVPLPDGSKAYVANIGSGTASVIDVASGAVTTIPCEDGSEGIDASPDGRWVWVTNRDADSISVIDTETDAVVETLEAGQFPIRVKFTPDGTHALVTNAVDGTLGLYDAETRKLVQTIPIGELPVGILVLPDGSGAYIANTRSDHVTVLDLESWSVTGKVRPGTQPDGMAVAGR